MESTVRTKPLPARPLLFFPGMKTFRALTISCFLGLTLGATTLAAAPATVQGKSGTLDVTTLKPSDWASWPEVSIPTVADVQGSCFEVERQCRRSGTAASLCAKEKRACLAPTTM